MPVVRQLLDITLEVGASLFSITVQIKHEHIFVADSHAFLKLLRLQLHTLIDFFFVSVGELFDGSRAY